MIIEYVRYTLPAERSEDFESAYDQIQPQLDESPECLRYELTRCVEEPTAYNLRLEWESIDAHLERFQKSEQFRALFPGIEPFVPDIVEMQHYALNDISSSTTRSER